MIAKNKRKPTQSASHNPALELGELDDGHVKDIGRRVFMNTIAKAEQRVLTELRDDCLSLFLKIKNTVPESDRDSAGQIRSKLVTGTIGSLDLSAAAGILDRGEF
jgi:hypothetical protein